MRRAGLGGGEGSWGGGGGACGLVGWVVGAFVEEMTMVEGGVQSRWVGVVRVTGSCVSQSDSEGVVMIGVVRCTSY